MERMPWDPVRDLLTMQERLESLFGRASPGWMPPVDLSESPERYLLTIELPGFDRTHVSIDLEGSSDHPRGGPGLLPGAYCSRARTGRVLAHVPFAAPIEGDAITADLANGVLTIQLPKTPQRHIDVG